MMIQTRESIDNKRNKLSYTDPTIIFFGILLAMEGMCYSIAAPFLPSEANSIGISQSYLGVMFSAYPIAFALSSPFIG